MKVQASRTDRRHCLRPGGHPVEVATAERAAHGSREDKRPRICLHREVITQYRDDGLRDPDQSAASLGLRRPEQ